MRCRRVKRQTTENTIVWFGSYGLNSDGTAKFFNENDKHDNYSDQQQGVADSLIQRLSVIKNELWYNINYGLPLIEKIKSKTELDSVVASIIFSHPDVVDIISFESRIVNKHYIMNANISSKYGELQLDI